tara:strand:- start:591 stop:1463 length:873 start_codon:yes stop_codon:yes gene_type:complete
MERSESKTDAKNSIRDQSVDNATEIRPYYRVHPGGSGSKTEQPMEVVLSRADALLRHERQSCTEPMLSLLVPTYNAECWISGVLETLLSLQAEKEILIVDDRSTDATISLVQSFQDKHPEISLLQHDVHRGHNATLRTGIAGAFGKVVVVLEEITEIKNKDVVMLVKPILAGCCDVVYGSHHILSSPEEESKWMRLVNRILTGILNLSTGQHLSHTRSPLKAFRRTTLDAISMSTSRRATDIEMIFRLSENGQRIYEMPLDSCVKSKSAAGFFHQQIGIAIQVIRHALHF